MTAASAEFKRILVGVHHGSPQGSLRCAAELAALLRLEVLGLFVKEERLIELAALPFAREFRLPGGWRKFEAEGMVRELDIAARVAQRAFADAVKSLSTAHEFRIVHGSGADAILSALRGGDIVVVGEPASHADRENLDSSALVETACQSASAVVLVPKRVLRSSGTVVAIATEKGDPSIRVAASLASRARADLVVLEESSARADRAEPGGEIPSTVTRPTDDLAAQLAHRSGIMSIFRNLEERLIVLRRGALDRSAPATIAAVRRQPVLIVN